MMFQPPPVAPGTESWGERYGVIGVVAMLALTVLLMVGRQVLKERAEDRVKRDENTKRLEKERDEALKRESDLNERIVEIVRESHRETLALTGEMNSRYHALLERTNKENREVVTSLQDRDRANTEVMRSLLRRARDGDSKGPKDT